MNPSKAKRRKTSPRPDGSHRETPQREGEPHLDDPSGLSSEDRGAPSRAEGGGAGDTPLKRRDLAQARRFLKDVKKLLEKQKGRVSSEDRDKVDLAIRKLEIALEAARESLEGRADVDKTAKAGHGLHAAMSELDLRVEQVLGFAKKSTLREYAESIFVAILIAVVLRAFVVEAFKIPTGSMIPTLAVGDHIFVNKFIYGLRIPLTNAWFVEWGGPKHGDVIVFRYPRDLSKDYIKRVVALAGDRVRVEGQEVFVNGRRLGRAEAEVFTFVDEGEDDTPPSFAMVQHVLAYPETSTGGEPHRYTVLYSRGGRKIDRFPSGGNLPGLECTYDRPEAHGECTVQSGYLFVMGDNRDNSSDSRVWGGVPISFVKGRALFVWWSRGPQSGVRWGRIGTVVE